LTPRAVLLPDCGAGVGLGHLERMLALADALRPDVETSIVTPAGDAALRRRVVDRGHAPFELAGTADHRAETAAVAAAPDVVVLDGYGFSVALQGDLRSRCPIVVVDDLCLPAACELAVNPSPGGELLRPVGADAFLGGAAYALLSSAFTDARETVHLRGRRRRSALVSTGATDLRGIMGRVAVELLERDREVIVLAVLSSETPRSDLPDDPRLRVLRAPASLATPLADATVYVGAAGTTALQAACIGIPAVITPAVSNQAGVAAALVAAGCAVSAPEAQLAAECLRLLDDPARCEEMSRRGRILIDGGGAPRVAESVRHLVRSRAA
jgi:UDP-2,4-diacetamido-2,4,6-trideoxy-beta-L-altropyranose hydrolase